MIEFNPNKVAYYNKVSGEYLKLVKQSEIDKKTSSSTPNPDIKVLKIVPESPIYTIGEDNRYREAHLHIGNIDYFLNQEDCQTLNKGVLDMYKSVSKYVSYETLQSCLYNWIFLFTFKKIETPLCDYIQSEIESKTSTYTFYFPLYSLHLDRSIKIGNVHFCIVRECETLKVRIPKEIEHDANTVFASIDKEGEYGRIEQLAYDEVSFAIDILKVCSFIDYSKEESYMFDISLDASSYFPVLFRSFTYDRKKSCNNFNIENLKHPYEFKSNSKFPNEYLAVFDSFMEDYFRDEVKSEITNIIYKSICRFSKSLTTKSIEDRIVLLCSIMDGIVLSNQEVGIKESLKKYIPIILTDTKETRSHLQKILEEMYKLRSDYIHHGENAKNMDSSKLLKYNFIVFNLITILIELRNSYNTLDELRKHIDELFLSVKF